MSSTNSTGAKSTRTALGRGYSLASKQLSAAGMTGSSSPTRVPMLMGTGPVLHSSGSQLDVDLLAEVSAADMYGGRELVSAVAGAYPSYEGVSVGAAADELPRCVDFSPRVQDGSEAPIGALLARYRQPGKTSPQGPHLQLGYTGMSPRG